VQVVIDVSNAPSFEAKAVLEFFDGLIGLSSIRHRLLWF
jgi:hypothetical protein